MSDRDKTSTPEPPVAPTARQFAGNLYLIGYRGTGKSTVALLLAQQLGLPMIDMDELLESRSGLSIRMIFAHEGEAGFRKREGAILEEVAQMRECIVATGGGLVLSSTNRSLLRASGRMAWLTAAPATIWQRLQADATTWDRRPNLSVGGPEEVEELLHAREPFYRECADCTVDTTGRSPEEVATLVRAHLNLD
jgi:shikimate kinase